MISLKKPTSLGVIVTSTVAIPPGGMGCFGYSTEAQPQVELAAMITSGLSPVFFTSKSYFLQSPTFKAPKSALMGLTSLVVINLSSFSLAVS
nr:hypothetical protein [Parabacteroides distasonis]